jgi:hypothetical protein
MVDLFSRTYYTITAGPLVFAAYHLIFFYDKGTAESWAPLCRILKPAVS